MSKSFIDEVKELDTNRTHGDWEYRKEGIPHYQYISKNGERNLEDSIIFDDGIYPIESSDMEFIAASPRLVKVILAIDELCNETYKQEPRFKASEEYKIMAAAQNCLIDRIRKILEGAGK